MTPAGTNVNEGDPMHNVNVQAVEQTAARATAWLADPKGVKPDSAMPKIPLTDAEIKDVVAYLKENPLLLLFLVAASGYLTRALPFSLPLAAAAASSHCSIKAEA